MKRLFYLTTLMFLVISCRSEETKHLQLASISLQSIIMPPTEKETPKTDTTNLISIAIFNFENRTGDPALTWLETGISDMFETQLHKTPDLNILTMDDLSDAASDLKYENEDLFNMYAAILTAKKVNADLIISGNFYQKSDSLYIDVLLKNIHTGENLCSETVKGHGMEQLLAMLDTISSHIQENIPSALKATNKIDTLK
jgi:TolB-like protein